MPETTTATRSPSSPPSTQPQPQGPFPVTASISYEGILPPPAMLRGFEEVLPGSAERLLAMAERQSRHRQEIEKRVVDGNVRAQTRGQYFGFSIAAICCIAGALLAYFGKSVEGLTTVIGALAALVTVFVIVRRQQSSERAQKRAETFVVPGKG